MARFVHYRCPDCGGTFRFLHHPSDSDPPDRCQLCHAWMSDDEPPEEIFVPQAPGIKKSPYAKSVDQTYRAMEDASIQRAKDAADMAGVPESEMNHLKITNMRDPSEMREGDTAAIMPAASVAAQRLTIGQSAPGWQDLSGTIPSVMPGVGPAKAGDTTRQSVGNSHSSRASQMVRAGEMGRYSE
jgi:hypothetical protein